MGWAWIEVYNLYSTPFGLLGYELSLDRQWAFRSTSSGAWEGFQKTLTSCSGVSGVKTFRLKSSNRELKRNGASYQELYPFNTSYEFDLLCMEIVNKINK